VISSSSGWAHGVRTAPGSVHVVYCYAPARWLYTPKRYLESSVKPRVLAPVIRSLRRWDRHVAHRADRYIVISQDVRARVRAAYGIDADVVYPPVDTERFRVTPRGDRLLVVSRLLAYKRIDLVVHAANRLGIGLDIVGIGPALNSLKAIAGPTVTFHGRLPDPEITELFESCYAFCLPGEEDFGIAPIEANAAGKPVIAYAAGGALETLQDDFSAAFFHEQTVEALMSALRRVDRLDTSPADLAQSARRFSREVFHVSLRQAIDRLYARRNGSLGSVPAA
jgi:glycosyltransferase involved in cell wall biosynthesis